MATLNLSDIKVQEIDSSLDLELADNKPISKTVILPAKETDDSMNIDVS